MRTATVPVAVRGVSRRTSGQRCVWRDAKHRARDARAPCSKQSCGSRWVKVRQTDQGFGGVSPYRQIVCNFFKMNRLQNNWRSMRSNPVKVNQTDRMSFFEVGAGEGNRILHVFAAPCVTLQPRATYRHLVSGETARERTPLQFSWH